MVRLSRRFRFHRSGHGPGPRSLATTCGVSVDVLSSRYLDVSVPWVRLTRLCIHRAIPSEDGGLPHSEIRGSKVARTSPQLIAACHVLHRLSVPRHSPNALEALESSRHPYAGQGPHGGCRLNRPGRPECAPRGSLPVTRIALDLLLHDVQEQTITPKDPRTSAEHAVIARRKHQNWWRRTGSNR